VIPLLLLASAAEATPEYAWPTTYGAYVSAYYDNAGGGLLDWSCGTRTYDGHRGTDIAGLARNTPVYAGDGGSVIRRYDGFGDGWWGNYDGGGFGNHVALYHGSGDTTIYGHLTAYSGLPALYATVDCYDPIGGIGTSGNSTGLHLHFETRIGTDGVNYYSGSADDPFQGACSGPVSYWSDQNNGTPTPDCAGGVVNPPDFCDGKMDGDWCDGGDLVTCGGGDVARRDTCPAGCISMPLGTPDECAATTVDFCDGKMNGDWCDGDDLVECQSGVSVNRDNCFWGCESMPIGVADRCHAEPSFCDGKANGLWCDGSDLVNCSGGAESSRDTCGNGCESMPVGIPDRCYPDSDACAGLMDGLWCDGDDLVDCDGGQVTSREGCTYGCTSMPVGTPDECASSPSGTCLYDPGLEAGAPTTSCNYMDWDLSDDGYYVMSKFGADTDSTTWGHTTTCGYLQGYYDAYGCRYDSGVGCLDYDDEIAWTQGHVDWYTSDMYLRNDQHAGGDVPYPHYFYVAGAQRFGCGTVLRVSNIDTGACVVVYAEDGGPGQTYEGPAYAGRRILDASPAVSDYLGVTGIGWLYGDDVYVEWGLAGDVPGEACTPCASTPAAAGSEWRRGPHDPDHMMTLSCR
jgi:hypothetical protein